jgi:hypothetical protein
MSMPGTEVVSKIGAALTQNLNKMTSDCFPVLSATVHFIRELLPKGKVQYG